MFQLFIFVLSTVLYAESTHTNPDPLGFRQTDPGEINRNVICPGDRDKDPEWKNKLVIHHLYVDQGDATFIRTPAGTTILIDAGLPGMGKRNVLPTLRQCYGISSVDYIVVSHPHLDHYGGLIELLGDDSLSVNQRVFSPPLVTEEGGSNSSLTKLMKALDVQGKEAQVPRLGTHTIIDSSNIDKKVTFDILAVNGKIKGKSRTVPSVLDRNGLPTDQNATSIAMKIRLGKFDYVTSGDLSGGGNGTPDVETPLSKIVGDTDVFKSNHHGSDTANNSNLMKALHAENVVMSVGIAGSNRSRYHLPRKGALDRMVDSGVEGIFMTTRGQSKDLPDKFDTDGSYPVTVANGDIILITDGDTYTFYGDRGIRKTFTADGK